MRELYQRAFCLFDKWTQVVRNQCEDADWFENSGNHGMEASFAVTKKYIYDAMRRCLLTDE
jgi:hypothetical protein